MAGRAFRIGGWILAGLVCANAADPPAVIGWYNGDSQSGLPESVVGDPKEHDAGEGWEEGGGLGGEPRNAGSHPGPGAVPGESHGRVPLQVDGLHIRLAPGRGGSARGGEWYANATLGKIKVNNRLADNERALVSKTTFGVRFVDVMALSTPGQHGRAREFSQGVLIEARDSH